MHYSDVYFLNYFISSPNRNLAALLSFHHQNSIPRRPSLVSQQCFDEPDGALSAPSTREQSRSNSNPDSNFFQPEPQARTGKSPLPRSQTFHLGGTGQEPTTTANSRRVGRSLIMESDPVLYDRAIREATYNVHAETIAITSMSLYEGKAKTVAEMSENNPDFLQFEVGAQTGVSLVWKIRSIMNVIIRVGRRHQKYFKTVQQHSRFWTEYFGETLLHPQRMVAELRLTDPFPELAVGAGWQCPWTWCF